MPAIGLELQGNLGGMSDPVSVSQQLEYSRFFVMCRLTSLGDPCGGYGGCQYWTKRRLFLFPKRHSTTAHTAFTLCGTASHLKEDMQKDAHKGTWGSKDFDIYGMSQGPGTNPPWMPTADCTLLELLKMKQKPELMQSMWLTARADSSPLSYTGIFYFSWSPIVCEVAEIKQVPKS